MLQAPYMAHAYLLHMWGKTICWEIIWDKFFKLHSSALQPSKGYIHPVIDFLRVSCKPIRRDDYSRFNCSAVYSPIVRSRFSSIFWLFSSPLKTSQRSNNSLLIWSRSWDTLFKTILSMLNAVWPCSDSCFGNCHKAMERLKLIPGLILLILIISEHPWFSSLYFKF